MNTSNASSPKMDPFINAPQPPPSNAKAIAQAVAQAGVGPGPEGTHPSIHVSLYAYGGVSAACLMSWIGLASVFSTSDRPTDLRTIREDALISRSRCRATQWFLDSGKDVWVQIDHDIEFDPADIIRMAELAHEKQATVSIPYSCRALPARPALRPDPDHLQALKHQVNAAECATELVPITMFASGCLAIPRKRLLEALSALEGSEVQAPYRIDWCDDVRVHKFPTLWMPFQHESLPGKLEYLSEDYAAALRLSLVGMEHYSMLPKKQLNHWGEFPFSFAPYAG